jgi:hypothetical protein
MILIFDQYSNVLITKLIHEQDWPYFPKIIDELMSMANSSFKQDKS